MTNISLPAPSRHRRRLATAGLALAGLLGTVFLAAAAAQASPAAATGATTGRTIHLVAHEQQRKLLSEGGFGDEEIFRGTLDNATGTTNVGIFAGTLTSVSGNDSLNLATVDLQLPGGQITVQGFADFTQPRIVGESAEAASGPNQRVEPVTAASRVNFDLEGDYIPPTAAELHAAPPVRDASAAVKPAPPAPPHPLSPKTPQQKGAAR